MEHLADIDRLVNESLQMLSRFQDLNTKILPLMEDYLIALRSRDNTPASLLRMDKNHEEEMINNYTSDMKAIVMEESAALGLQTVEVPDVIAVQGCVRVVFGERQQIFETGQVRAERERALQRVQRAARPAHASARPRWWRGSPSPRPEPHARLWEDRSQLSRR